MIEVLYFLILTESNKESPVVWPVTCLYNGEIIIWRILDISQIENSHIILGRLEVEQYRQLITT